MAKKPKMARNGHFRPKKGQKWPEMAKKPKMARNGQKAKNCLKWPKMAKNKKTPNIFQRAFI